MINTASPRAGARLLQPNQTQNAQKICKRMVGTPLVPAPACSDKAKFRTRKKVCKRMVGTRPRVPANACSDKAKLRTRKRFASAW